jgi:hypothetical protein
VTDQHVLVAVVESIPGHRDEIGATLDVERAVALVGDVVVIDPDVVSEHLDVDAVVGTVGDHHVPDNHIVHGIGWGRGNAVADREADVESAAGDAGRRAHAKDALVGRHVVHRTGHGDEAFHPDHERSGLRDGLEELCGGTNGHDGSALASRGAVLAKGVHRGEADRTVTAGRLAHDHRDRVGAGELRIGTAERQRIGTQRAERRRDAERVGIGTERHRARAAAARPRAAHRARRVGQTVVAYRAVEKRGAGLSHGLVGAGVHLRRLIGSLRIDHDAHGIDA